jgi:hypothetical protein
MPQQFLTVAEFRDTYRISNSEFYRQVAAKNLVLTKLGRASRIAVHDANAWAASLPKSAVMS